MTARKYNRKQLFKQFKKVNSKRADELEFIWQFYVVVQMSKYWSDCKSVLHQRNKYNAQLKYNTVPKYIMTITAIVHVPYISTKQVKTGVTNY